MSFVIFPISFLLFFPFLLPAQTQLSQSLGKGLTATVIVHHATTGAAPAPAIRQAIGEGQRVLKEFGPSGGEVALVNKNAGKRFVKVSDPFLKLLHACMQVYDWTGGLFDVVKGRSGNGEGDPQLQVSFAKGEVFLPEPGTRIDLSGIVAGYAVDRMAGSLLGQGFGNFMIQAGTNYRTSGRNGSDYWRINILDPKVNRMLCRVSLESSSVSTSDSRNLKEKGGNEPTDLQSVTVITKNATNATALATTGLLVGKGRALALFSKIAARGFGVILEDLNGKITTVGDVTAACFEE